MPLNWGYILLIVISLIGLIVQGKLKSKFKKYGRIPLRAGYTGKEIAEMMLADHGIHDVKVISTPGALTDHYNPLKKTVNLSGPVYASDSVAAAAVAAHEVGHAVQHAVGYRWLKLRSALVPVVSFSSKIVMFVLILGILMIEAVPQLLLFGIILFALSVVFSFITLPVEYDASARAKRWLESRGLVTPEEKKGVADALKWAARTYVVAALSSLATLLYYLNIYNNRR
ncbi:MAG: zinc metallopeptidase [Chlorobi bacterium]|nr:zinc metallopeptidase [Chlorobiota bacterium]